MSVFPFGDLLFREAAAVLELFLGQAKLDAALFQQRDERVSGACGWHAAFPKLSVDGPRESRLYRLRE